METMDPIYATEAHTPGTEARLTQSLSLLFCSFFPTFLSFPTSLYHS